MKDNQKAGLSLICGALGAVVTMAIHPTADTPHLALVSGIAHGLALLSVLVIWLGALGLTLALNAPDRLAITALAAYAFATVAVMLAATVSGFIMPNLLDMMARDIPAAAPYWRIVIAAIFQINQAFSKIYSVAAALAICLWSICCLCQRKSRAIAFYGIITSALVTLLILVGHLRLNIHGMAIVMVSQAIWFVAVGAWLRSKPSSSAPTVSAT